MKCKNVVELLNRLAPETLACEWDNVGLTVGRFDKNVSKILVALEVTNDVVNKAIEEQADDHYTSSFDFSISEKDK